jgi:hypothetical protein
VPVALKLSDDFALPFNVTSTFENVPFREGEVITDHGLFHERSTFPDVSRCTQLLLLKRNISFINRSLSSAANWARHIGVDGCPAALVSTSLNGGRGYEELQS